MYTYTDQSGKDRVGKLPIVATEEQAKGILSLVVSGHDCSLFDQTNSTLLDKSEFAKGVQYSCVQVTCTDSQGARVSFPFVTEESDDEGALTKTFSDALTGLDMLGDGTNGVVTRVTATVVATFTA
jgi:hypothetical protein